MFTFSFRRKTVERTTANAGSWQQKVFNRLVDVSRPQQLVQPPSTPSKKKEGKGFIRENAKLTRRRS